MNRARQKQPKYQNVVTVRTEIRERCILSPFQWRYRLFDKLARYAYIGITIDKSFSGTHAKNFISLILVKFEEH